MALEASRLSLYNKRCTLTGKEVQSAVRLLYAGDLGKHDASEGMKSVHLDAGIVDCSVGDLFQSVALEASRLSLLSERHTLAGREIQSAVRLLYAGELGKHV
ncbi:H2B protein, partial [Polyodon spathula]|nr:H2B protein [Polyodon spathula]